MIENTKLTAKYHHRTMTGAEGWYPPRDDSSGPGLEPPAARYSELFRGLSKVAFFHYKSC